MEKTFRHNSFTATFSDEGTKPENRYFSFTGEINGSLGACGNKIAEIYPPFQILEDLHLAKLDGEPMYALENGFFHFRECGWDIRALEKYWKVELTDDQKKRIADGHLKQVVSFVMEEIRPLWAAKVKAAYALVRSTPSDLTEIDETISIDDFDEPEKVRALASYLEIHFSTITEDGGDRYLAQGIEYMVLNDEEADDEWNKNLNNYLEECVYPELPENLRNYFDNEKWKEDAKDDGRGNSLSGYDGVETEITDPETEEIFFAYRQ